MINTKDGYIYMSNKFISSKIELLQKKREKTPKIAQKERFFSIIQFKFCGFMSLIMYLHMLCRSSMNPLIWRFFKHYFCESNGNLIFLDKICKARVQKRQYFFCGEFCRGDRSNLPPKDQS